MYSIYDPPVEAEGSPLRWICSRAIRLHLVFQLALNIEENERMSMKKRKPLMTVRIIKKKLLKFLNFSIHFPFIPPQLSLCHHNLCHIALGKVKFHFGLHNFHAHTHIHMHTYTQIFQFGFSLFSMHFLNDNSQCDFTWN